MKKQLIAALVFVPSICLTSCMTEGPTYYPGYANDYVYSIGYYGYRPYWGTRYDGRPGLRGFDPQPWRGYYKPSRAYYGYVRRW